MSLRDDPLVSDVSACLTIDAPRFMVWHGGTTMVDPDNMPMSSALTAKMTGRAAVASARALALALACVMSGIGCDSGDAEECGTLSTVLCERALVFDPDTLVEVHVGYPAAIDSSVTRSLYWAHEMDELQRYLEEVLAPGREAARAAVLRLGGEILEDFRSAPVLLVRIRAGDLLALGTDPAVLSVSQTDSPGTPVVTSDRM